MCRNCVLFVGNPIGSFLFAIDKQNGDRDAIVTITGAMQDAQDAKTKVLDIVGSQRTNDRNSYNRDRSDDNRRSNHFDNNRGSNRSDGNRYDSRGNTSNDRFGSSNDPSGSYSNANPPQQNAAPEPMEFEMIDWQAAARESVCIHQISNYIEPIQ